jgi:hypothetical protein
MNSQDLSNLQEAYLEVYQELVEEVLDEKIATPPSWWNARKGLDAATRRRRRSRDFDTYGGENQEDLYGKERKISTSKGEGGITKNPKKLRKQKAMGEFREQVDLYDIILSHLLDEGYADTQEQAEVIMVNMSEDWRESIVEGMKPLPVGKMAKQAERKAFYHNLDYEPWSYYTNTNRQLRTMSEVGGKKVKKAAKKGRELANDVDNRLYRKYAPPDLHR